MRLEYVLNSSIGMDAKRSSIMVEMEYLPVVSSNRRLTRSQGGDTILRSDVYKWMEQLTFMVRALKNSASLVFTAPVKVRIDGVFKDERAMPDLHNFRKAVDDAVEEALGINDKWFETETGIPVVGLEPKIIINISSEG